MLDAHHDDISTNQQLLSIIPTTFPLDDRYERYLRLHHMPYFSKIMPREVRTTTAHSAASTTAPYPQAATTAQRTAAIWSSSDDEILLRARASGLNWQPIASKHFPNKTANACRKRHERLIERRNGEDWDNDKLELLAQEYLACRKEMWEVLASRLNVRWNIVEAKVRPRQYCNHLGRD